MCFSAGVSFGASALLVGTGVVAIKKTDPPRMLAFASIPILFGVQQLSEGILWLTFSNPELDYWHNPSIYFFLIIAQVIWPIWIPFAVWLMEPNKTRKKIISYFLFLGGAFSSYILFCLFTYEVTVFAEARHIRYDLHFPHFALRRSLNFLLPVVPIFLSSLRLMKLLGGALLGALILSLIFFYQFVLSVWCFFGAILSVVVVFVIVYNKKSIGRASLT